MNTPARVDIGLVCGRAPGGHEEEIGRESARYVLCMINKYELRCFVDRRERVQCRTCVPNIQLKSRTCRPKTRTRNGSAVVLLCRRCCLVLRATLRCAARTAEHRAELLYNIVWDILLGSYQNFTLRTQRTTFGFHTNCDIINTFCCSLLLSWCAARGNLTYFEI